MRRREFLALSATSIGGVLVYSLDREVVRLSAQTNQSIRIPLRFFSQAEALLVAAAASRIFPSDEAGPGAQEAGVAVYIDRQLAGPWGHDRHRYTQGPFEENAPAESASQSVLLSRSHSAESTRLRWFQHSGFRTLHHHGLGRSQGA
jgi:gluconate 2-dehydrogenase gamma chain